MSTLTMTLNACQFIGSATAKRIAQMVLTKKIAIKQQQLSTQHRPMVATRVRMPTMMPTMAVLMAVAPPAKALHATISPTAFQSRGSATAKRIAEMVLTKKIAAAPPVHLASLPAATRTAFQPRGRATNGRTAATVLMKRIAARIPRRRGELQHHIQPLPPRPRRRDPPPPTFLALVKQWYVSIRDGIIYIRVCNCVYLASFVVKYCG